MLVIALPRPAASVVFMGGVVEASKKSLAVYPVLLFYVIIAWMVFIQ